MIPPTVDFRSICIHKYRKEIRNTINPFIASFQKKRHSSSALTRCVIYFCDFVEILYVFTFEFLFLNPTNERKNFNGNGKRIIDECKQCKEKNCHYVPLNTIVDITDISLSLFARKYALRLKRISFLYATYGLSIHAIIHNLLISGAFFVLKCFHVAL